MTPAPVRPRDHSIDAVRAVAMTGVVGGHWLVTGLRIDGDGAWRQASPLTAMPGLAAVSWVLQTLGLFFFAGGFAAARSLAGRSERRVGRSVRRLVWPLAGLLALWSVVLGIAAAVGTPAPTLRTIAVLVVSPLWFLLPYLALRVVTAPLAKIVDRGGPWVIALPAIGLVAASDMGRVPGWLAVPAAWSVPWVLGIALARNRAAVPLDRSSGTVLLGIGAGGMAVLIGVCGYPVSAVGVPGDGRSNLAPPSLVAVALALAQIGIFRLMRDRLSGPPVRAVATLNRSALPIFLSHQSVLIATAATVSAIADLPVPGLLTAPADPWWIMQRVAWLPFLALVLITVIKPRWWTARRVRLP